MSLCLDSKTDEFPHCHSMVDLCEPHRKWKYNKCQTGHTDHRNTTWKRNKHICQKLNFYTPLCISCEVWSDVENGPRLCTSKWKPNVWLSVVSAVSETCAVPVNHPALLWGKGSLLASKQTKFLPDFFSVENFVLNRQFSGLWWFYTECRAARVSSAPSSLLCR